MVDREIARLDAESAKFDRENLDDYNNFKKKCVIEKDKENKERIEKCRADKEASVKQQFDNECFDKFVNDIENWINACSVNLYSSAMIKDGAFKLYVKKQRGQHFNNRQYSEFKTEIKAAIQRVEDEFKLMIIKYNEPKLKIDEPVIIKRKYIEKSLTSYDLFYRCVNECVDDCDDECMKYNIYWYEKYSDEIGKHNEMIAKFTDRQIDAINISNKIIADEAKYNPQNIKHPNDEWRITHDHISDHGIWIDIANINYPDDKDKCIKFINKYNYKAKAINFRIIEYHMKKTNDIQAEKDQLEQDKHTQDKIINEELQKKRHEEYGKPYDGAKLKKLIALEIARRNIEVKEILKAEKEAKLKVEEKSEKQLETKINTDFIAPEGTTKCYYIIITTSLCDHRGVLSMLNQILTSDMYSCKGYYFAWGITEDDNPQVHLLYWTNRYFEVIKIQYGLDCKVIASKDTKIIKEENDFKSRAGYNHNVYYKKVKQLCDKTEKKYTINLQDSCADFIKYYHKNEVRSNTYFDINGIPSRKTNLNLLAII